MKKLTVLAHMCLSFSLLQTINAQEDQESTFDKIWNNVVLYENDENYVSVKQAREKKKREKAKKDNDKK